MGSELDIAVQRFKDAFKRQQRAESVRDAWLRMSLTSTQKRLNTGKEANNVLNKRRNI